MTIGFVARLRLAPLALLCLATAGILASACSRRSLPVYDDSEAAAAEAVPGLISVELRGATEEHRLLVAGLGQILEEQVVQDDENDLPFLPRDRFSETVFLVDTKDAAHAAAALKALRGRADVLFAEPVVRLHALGWTPNDPGYAKQWHLRAAGAPQAWEASRGAGVREVVFKPEAMKDLYQLADRVLA